MPSMKLGIARKPNAVDAENRSKTPPGRRTESSATGTAIPSAMSWAITMSCRDTGSRSAMACATGSPLR